MKSKVQAAAAAPTPHRGRRPQKIYRQSAGVPLIEGVQPVRVLYNNAEY